MYKAAGLFQTLLCVGRPRICPFDELSSHVSEGASVLDIGCGVGLFLNLLARKGRLASAVGFDAAATPIGFANLALKTFKSAAEVRFEHRSAEAGLPQGKFSVVSMIDVLHHIAPEYQRSTILEAASRVAPGGTFLFKDIGSRPIWRAWANRIHDLVLARQWINYVEEDDVEKWMISAGFDLVDKRTINMWWYGHKLITFKSVETRK